MLKIHEQKSNKLQQSRAPKLRLDKVLLSPPRARKGSGLHLSPLTADDIRRELKSQLNSCQVVVKRTSDGGFAVLRDPNWGRRLRTLLERARREGSTLQEQKKLFDHFVNEEVEKLTRQTEPQVRKVVRLLRRILAPRRSPRRPIRRRNVVVLRSRSRQPRRSGRTRAPTASTGGEENSGDGDKSDSSSIGLIQRTQRGLDEVYFVKPFCFAPYTTQVGFAKLQAGKQGLAADLRAFVSPHKNTHLTEVYNQYALCEF